MKTALRTYHPVPALQKTNDNLQDAPRIKNILKTCFLPGETQGMVTTPGDVLTRTVSELPAFVYLLQPTPWMDLARGHCPTDQHSQPAVCLCQPFFGKCLANDRIQHVAYCRLIDAPLQAISRSHFAPSRAPIEFLDLFTPVHVSSQSRARVFLWLCYHYHETASSNPFVDQTCEDIPDRAPPFDPLSQEQAQAENIDTPEEDQRGVEMTNIRRRFLEAKAREELGKTPEDDLTRPQGSVSRGRGKAKGRGLVESSSIFRVRDTSPTDSQYSVSYSYRDEDILEGAYASVARASHIHPIFFHRTWAAAFTAASVPTSPAFRHAYACVPAISATFSTRLLARSCLISTRGCRPVPPSTAQSLQRSAPTQ